MSWIDFLISKTTSESVCWIYRISNVYGIESLWLKFEQQITMNTKEIFASEHFLKCDKKKVKTLE